MAKKKSWLHFLKCLFTCEAKPNPEKKCMKWSWVFGRYKIKQQPAIVAPERTVLSEAREEQRKHALNVAMATAAAADAAVAAAHAAAQLVRLTDAASPSPSPSYHLNDTRIQNRAAARIQNVAAARIQNMAATRVQNMAATPTRIQNMAAMTIQCAYRRHLARKAFRALKGLVKLQAMVRGRIVRRKAATTWNYFSPIEKIPSMAHQRRVLLKHERFKNGEIQQILTPKELECSGWGSWDDNIISLEDMEAIWSRKKEAIAQRERLTHSFSHRERRRDDRMVELPSQNKENGRVDSIERVIDRPSSIHRRSFTRTKQNSISDDYSYPRSPNLPTYMSTTESAKAKSRSLSMPKQRLSVMDSRSDYNSPRKNNRLSFVPSLSEESMSSSKRRNGITI